MTFIFVIGKPMSCLLLGTHTKGVSPTATVQGVLHCCSPGPLHGLTMVMLIFPPCWSCWGWKGLSGGKGHLQTHRFPLEVVTLDKCKFHLYSCCILQRGQCFAVARCHVARNGFCGDEPMSQSLGGPAESHCCQGGAGWVVWGEQQGGIAPLGSARRLDELCPIVSMCRWGPGLSSHKELPERGRSTNWHLSGACEYLRFHTEV